LRVVLVSALFVIHLHPKTFLSDSEFCFPTGMYKWHKVEVRQEVRQRFQNTDNYNVVVSLRVEVQQRLNFFLVCSCYAFSLYTTLLEASEVLKVYQITS
jgi:hypothetical protein